MTTEIIYCTKRLMTATQKFPYFGVAIYAENLILIRSDLPKCVQRSVEAHERKHLELGDRGSFWKNEPPAWLAGFKAQPFGFLLGIVMSCTPERIGLYVKRLRGNF